MKVAQNYETNPNMQPVRPPHTPNMSNTQLSPSGPSVRKRDTSGILSRMFPLRRYHFLPRQGIPSTAYCLVMFYDAWFAPYLLFLPLLLRQTLRPTLLLPSSTTELTTPPSCQRNQASPPFDHQISPILPSTACIRIVQHVTVSINPILLHSLSLLLQSLIPYPQS